MVNIRLVQSKDGHCINMLLQQMADFERPLWREKTEIIEGDARLVEKYFSESSSSNHLYVAEKHEEVIGLILWEPRKDFFNQENTIHISALSVCKSVSGNGVGTLLMQFAESEAQKMGVRLISLNVSKKIDIARNLYGKLGFQEEVISMIKRIG